MMTRIQDLHDSGQAALIRRLTGSEDVTPPVYARGHARYLQRVPGRPVPHTSRATILMEINFGRWMALCPECRSGMHTARGWPEIRCFGCGAVFPRVLWPDDAEALEAAMLRRPPVAQYWRPPETLAQVVADNIAHGVQEVG